MSEDLISRQAAIVAVLYAKDDLDAERLIKGLPSAQRKGKWIATQEWGGRNYSCSCCKFSFMVDTCMLEPMWNFCPNCGAIMEGGES